MPISVYDRNFRNKWQPYFNGVLLRDCVEFDTGAGCAIVLKRNDDGLAFLDHRNHIATRIITGRITAKRIK